MRVVDIREQGLVGSLFAGDDERPRPGVLVLGGSEGGFPSDVAGSLAAEGFTCLALAYFGAVGVPRRLVEIPLEYVDTAFAWLRKHPLVMNSRLGVLGISKGAELALLAAASFPDTVGAVVTSSPSGCLPRDRSGWRWIPSLELVAPERARALRALPTGRPAVPEPAGPLGRTDLSNGARQRRRGGRRRDPDRTKPRPDAADLGATRTGCGRITDGGDVDGSTQGRRSRRSGGPPAVPEDRTRTGTMGADRRVMARIFAVRPRRPPERQSGRPPGRLG
jgi:pimeloyl-ACP methyl ester carboxylesterase